MWCLICLERVGCAEMFGKAVFECSEIFRKAYFECLGMVGIVGGCDLRVFGNMQ